LPLAVAVGSLSIASVSTAGDGAQALSGPGSDSGLHATIRRTSHGIPHVLANDFASAGFGYGYAFAQDNLCVLAREYVKVNGEQSRYFGPDGSYSQGGNGATANNLNSDFFFQRIKDAGKIEDLLALPPPRGPRQEIKEGVRGFVAGYNKYLRETGVDNLPDSSCRGEPWVREITEMDAYRRFYQLGLIASQGVAIDGIGGAQPPHPPIVPQQPTQQERDDMIAELKQRLPLGGIGSNAYGLGRDATDNGRGMVLGNPHFPWDGSERFYQAQITIPGKGSVSGGSLFGVPVINIGHTENLAWSHTVSTAFRFTPFELKLVPGSPTTYLYDGEPRQMKEETVTVQVRNADGSLSPRTRTLYSSHHGSILTSILGLPLFPWTPGTAWAMGDANAGNFRYLNHFFEVNFAQSVDELHEIIVRNQGIPWVNTIAADSSGDALYADMSVVPHVTNEKAATCNTELGRATFAALGLPTLDGSLSSCEWGSDPDAVEPGIFGPSNLPKLFRDDYVTNSNDSYWLSNPEEPLTGFDRIIGDENTERSLRTRLGLIMVQQRLAGADGHPGDRFTLPLLQEIMFNNRQYAGELWRTELSDFCYSNATLTNSSGASVDVSEACPIIEQWDQRDNLDSSGAVLFRRFASRALAAVGLERPPGIFDEEFSSAEPVHTPRGLNTVNPRVQQAFADAVTDLRSAGIPLDAGLRDWQYERRGSERIPIHGGPGGVGVFNAINVSWVGSGANPGFPNVPHGSSFVMAAKFTGDAGCPVDARTILTYSQSTNPSSPYFGDQTRKFSNKEWVDEAFCEDEIAADPNLEVTRLNGGASTPYPRPGGGSPVRVPLLPAYRECASSDQNANHVAPLALDACSPPRLESSELTTSEQGKASAFARLDVTPGIPGTPEDEADVRIAASASDVRSAGDGSDYTGQTILSAVIRITDRANGSSQVESATVQDVRLGLPVGCVATPAADLGSTCSLNTTADSMVPGFAREGKRAVISTFSFELLDAGADGDLSPSSDPLGLGCPPTCGSGDEGAFLRQGVYAP
jgi:acyl-homoserine-lactone acylase